jgi:histone deacetylase complex regulatory component SIN3
MFVHASCLLRVPDHLTKFTCIKRLVSQQYPATQSYYKDFVLKFVYEEVSLPRFQSDLSALLAHAPLLYDHFVGFLKANVSSKSQQTAAKQYFCALTGLPTQSPNQSRRTSMDEVSAFNVSVEVSAAYFLLQCSNSLGLLEH